ncbi:MAG: TonB-dependent receptor plug domain-containing protein, partial [Myxococcota bacterium]
MSTIFCLSVLAVGLVTLSPAHAQSAAPDQPDAAPADATPDAPGDAAADAPADATPDAPADAAPQPASPDTSPDTTGDAAPDAAGDAAPGVPVDAAPGAPADAPAEVSTDAAPSPAPAPSATPPAPAAASGTIAGRVVDAGSGRPLVAAVVQVQGRDLGALTAGDGRFSIAEVPAGRYRLVVTSAAGASAEAAVEVGAGQTAAVEVAVDVSSFAGEVIVVTGTRGPEKVFDAPVTVEAISAEAIERRGGPSYLSSLSEVKGIDFASSGLSDQRISARGFTTQFNSRMITMIDGRLAQIPGNGLPQGNFLPTGTMDIKAMEVVIGPASALYGANAHTGVINVVTKTPWDESGAAVTLRGGTQSLTDVAVRLAGTVDNIGPGELGWKINGQLFRASDFEPDCALPLHRYNTDLCESELIDDYDIASIKTDGSLYYKFGDWFAKATAGFSENDGFSLTNNGRNHIRDWRINYQAVQLSSPKVYAQVTRTASSAGG